MVYYPHHACAVFYFSQCGTAAQVLLQFEEDFRYTSAPQLQAAAAPENL